MVGFVINSIEDTYGIIPQKTTVKKNHKLQRSFWI